MHHPDENIMRELIHDQWTKHSIYAAVVDGDGKIIAKGRTTVGQDNDPTAHAEVNAIREACRQLEVSQFPAGCWLYSTFEPCPLCASAALWAGIDGIVYANNPDHRGKEENWSFLSCEEVLRAGSYIHQTRLVKDFLLEEIKEYFR
jgi:tRNA(Arg) A34 adenosine deaminase TadA